MLKKITKASIVLLFVGTLFFLLPPHFSSVHADDSSNTTFQVNVQEVLSVSITTPTNWAKGNINNFLRNEVTLAVTSNHIDGFTASMISSDTNAELHHSSKVNTVIPTFDDNESHTCTDNTTCPEFPANKWGFAINAGANTDDVYNQIPKASGAPTTLISNAQSTGQTPITSRDIYFGSKSDITQASGTYSGTVIFYVVSGIIDNTNNTNPNPPVNPTTDGSSTPTYANGQTVQTATTENRNSNNQVVSTTTTTTINEGDATSSYQEPAGVTDSTSSNIYDGSMLATGLAVTASVAAASGLTFFILAKRKKDDYDEEKPHKYVII